MKKEFIETPTHASRTSQPTNTGLALRLSELRRSGPVIVALDDRLTSGPTGHLADVSRLSQRLIHDGYSAFLGFPGTLAELATQAISSNAGVFLIMASNAATARGGRVLRRAIFDPLVASQAGASACSFHLNVGSKEETTALQEITTAIDRASVIGLPVMVASYPRSDDRTIENTSERILHAAIVAHEIGAQIIKIPHVVDPNLLKEIRAATPGRMVYVAGGEQRPPAVQRRTLDTVLCSGLDGMCVGRNMYALTDASKLNTCNDVL